MVEKKNENKLVLLVEDESVINETLTLKLTRMDFNVISVKSLNKALLEVERNTFDLIVLDICLSDGSGCSLVETVRSVPEHRNYSTPILIMSAHLDGELVARIKSWVNAIIVKPFNEQIFAEKVEQITTVNTSTSIQENSVLLVEDENEVNEVLKKKLIRMGLNVISVKSIRDALAEIEKNTFNLMIIDIRLPDGTGDTVVEMVRSNTANKNHATPILIMSAHLDNKLIETIKDKVDSIMTKPFYGPTFTSRVEKLMSTTNKASNKNKK